MILYNVDTMFIDDQTFTQKSKTYRRVLLRNSYRLNGKVCHDTVGNLSQCTDEEIEAIKLALEHKGDLKELVKAPDKVKTRQGLSVGAVWSLYQISRRLGITKALGGSREAKLTLWMVLACVIEQGSRLSAVRLASSMLRVISSGWMHLMKIISTKRWTGFMSDNTRLRRVCFIIAIVSVSHNFTSMMSPVVILKAIKMSLPTGASTGIGRRGRSRLLSAS